MNISSVRLGINNTYLVCGQSGCVLVDAGNAGRERKFQGCIDKIGIKPEDIKLIVVTHVHYDHVGSLRAIKQICGCPVAVHGAESGLLQNGEMTPPPGTNVIAAGISRISGYLPRWFAFEPVKPDILLAGEFSLEPFGLSGSIIHTPGHTTGSCSVLLPGGEALVGDLAFNYLPLGLGPVFPPFAWDVPELLRSWQKIIDSGATVIYPGHGPPFPVHRLKWALNRALKTKS